MTQVMVINCSTLQPKFVISCNDHMFSIGLLAQDYQKLKSYQELSKILSVSSMNKMISFTSFASKT